MSFASETPKEISEKPKKITIPGTSSPRIPFNTPPKSSDVQRRQEKISLSSPTSTASPVINSISSYLKHLLGLNAKTTKRSINEEAECGSPESIEEWIHKGSNVNELDSYGYTPLINASLTGCIKTVKILLKNGADVNMQAMHGYTALHVAAQNGFVELAELLIEHGAELELRNDDGDTPLMLAVRSEHSSIVDLLCRHGCNRHTIGFDKIDPIDYAISKRNQYVSDILLKHDRKESPSQECCLSSLNDSANNNSMTEELKSDNSMQHASINDSTSCPVFQSD